MRATLLIATALAVVAFPANTPAANLVNLALLAYLALAALLPLRDSLRSVLFLSALYIAGTSILLTWGIASDASVFYLALVVLAAVLYERPAEIVAGAIVSASIVVTGALALNSTIAISALAGDHYAQLLGGWLDWIVYLIDLLVMSAIMGLAIRMLRKHLAHVLEGAKRASVREARQLDGPGGVSQHPPPSFDARAPLQTSLARIARQLVELPASTDTLDAALKLIATELACTHARLYLLPQAAGQPGLELSFPANRKDPVAPEKGVGLSPDSPAGIALRTRQIYHGEKPTGAAPHPGTARSSAGYLVALPLLARGTDIGALELRFEDDREWDAAAGATLQPLADVLTVAIENAQLRQDLQRIQAQSVSGPSTGKSTGWRQPRTAPVGYRYTPAATHQLKDGHVSAKAAEGSLQVPLLLRGARIGSITLRRDQNAPAWTGREQGLIEKIAGQAALALENSQLIEDVQQSARRNQLLANASGRVRETMDIDAIVQTAAREFVRAFDLTEAEIRLSPQTRISSPPSHSGEPGVGQPASGKPG
jgi:GAF domain-containing protein